MIPSSVDLLQRPDCLDDLIALAVAVCSLGPDYALNFWKHGEHIEDGKSPVPLLVPSRALEELLQALQKDDSLFPSYVAFLSALAKADNAELSVNGATAVYNLLSQDTSSSSSTNLTWETIFALLQWFAREFTTQAGSSTSTTTTAGDSFGDTSYYYNSSSTNSNDIYQNKTTSTAPKVKELGDTNTFHLQSLLLLISNVAQNCPPSRMKLLSMKLPIPGVDVTNQVAFDVTLNVMFTLATANLPPETRGTVFSTIASLLNTESCTKDDSANIRKMAVEAWKLVETCQILPINLLDQYPQPSFGAGRATSSVHFPPSSTSLVSYSGFDGAAL